MFSSPVLSKRFAPQHVSTPVSRKRICVEDNSCCPDESTLYVYSAAAVRMIPFTITLNNRDTLTVFNDTVGGDVSIDDLEDRLVCLLTCIWCFNQFIISGYVKFQGLCVPNPHQKGNI